MHKYNRQSYQRCDKLNYYSPRCNKLNYSPRHTKFNYNQRFKSMHGGCNKLNYSPRHTSPRHTKFNYNQRFKSMHRGGYLDFMPQSYQTQDEIMLFLDTKMAESNLDKSRSINRINVFDLDDKLSELIIDKESKNWVVNEINPTTEEHYKILWLNSYAHMYYRDGKHYVKDFIIRKLKTFNRWKEYPWLTDTQRDIIPDLLQNIDPDNLNRIINLCYEMHISQMAIIGL